MRDHPVFRHLLSVRVWLFLLLLGTVGFYALFPEYLRQGDCYTADTCVTAFATRQFILMPNIDRPVITAFTNTHYGVKVHYYDCVSGNKPESNFNDLEGDPRPYWDEQDQCIYTVLKNRYSNRIELLRTRLDANMDHSSKRWKLWDEPLYDEIVDTMVVAHGVRFLPTQYYWKGASIRIIEEPAGLRIAYADSAVIDSAQALWPQWIDDNTVVSRTAAMLRQRTGQPFSNRDVYRVLQFHRRNQWYKKKYLLNPNLHPVDYGRWYVCGRSDSDGDGYNEFLIHRGGDRFIEHKLICWDMERDSILWSFSGVGGCTVWFVADIDGDGRDEIGVGGNAPCNELPPHWFDNPDMGTTPVSRFVVLDDDGAIYRWGDTAGEFPLGGYGSQVYAFYSEETKKALLMLSTDMDRREKNFLTLDLATGQFDTLDATYVNARVRYRDEDDVVVWDYHDSRVHRWRFSPDLKPHRDGVFTLLSPPSDYHIDLRLNGEKHRMIAGSGVLDERLRVVYDFDHAGASYFAARPDTLFFIKQPGAEIGRIWMLSFAPNHKINPVAPLLVGFELLLFIIYWIVHAFIIAPITSGEKGYIVLWSLFGRVYFWRLLGRASIYRLPRYVAFDKRYFSSVVGGISGEYRRIFRRKVLLLDFSVFELDKVDELAVVQHLAHELKNRLHVMQLGIDETDEASRREVKDSLNWSFRAARTISDFSRVHTLAPATVDLREILEDTAHSLMSLPAFERLSLRLPEKPVLASVDRRLLGMALRNLLENALQAIEEDGWAEAGAQIEDGQAVITVRNAGEIAPDILERIVSTGGWSSKPEGAGVGVTVSRVITENHDGRFSLVSRDGAVTAKMYFKLKN